MAKSYERFRIICIFGIIISGYATYVKIQAERDDAYTALCDLAPKVSCTSVFKSFYGRGFGLSQHFFGAATHLNPSNGIVGLIFYSVLLLSSYTRRHWLCLLQLFFGILTNLLSLYLGYLLFVILEEYCLVCFLIYFVNKFLLIETWLIYNSQWRKKKYVKCVNKKD